MDFGNSWTGLKGTNSQQLRQYNTTIALVSNLMIYGTSFIIPSIQLKIDINLLKEISDKETSEWPPFLIAELFSAIKKYNNSLTPRLDKLGWRHIKKIIKDKECANRFIDIANTYFDLGHWPSHFKILTMVIILKLNKSAYNLPKFFWPIILLNTTGKLIEKMIGERFQFTSIFNNFIHPCQLGRLKHRSTTDVGVALSYFVCSGWIKNLTTSTLAFDIM